MLLSKLRLRTIIFIFRDFIVLSLCQSSVIVTLRDRTRFFKRSNQATNAYSEKCLHCPFHFYFTTLNKSKAEWLQYVCDIIAMFNPRSEKSRHFSSSSVSCSCFQKDVTILQFLTFLLHFYYTPYHTVRHSDFLSYFWIILTSCIPFSKSLFWFSSFLCWTCFHLKYYSLNHFVKNNSKNKNEKTKTYPRTTIGKSANWRNTNYKLHPFAIFTHDLKSLGKYEKTARNRDI